MKPSDQVAIIRSSIEISLLIMGNWLEESVAAESLLASLFLQIMTELCIKKYMLLFIPWVLWFHIIINHVVAEGILAQCVFQLWQRARQQLWKFARAYQAYVWISFATIRKDYRAVKVISPEYSAASVRIKTIYIIPWTAFNVKNIWRWFCERIN